MGGWREIELGHIVTMSKGIAYGSENYCDEGEGYIFITLKCIAKSGGFSRRGIKFYKGYVPENMKLRSGDLLLANTDLTRAGDVVGCPILLPNLGSEQPVTMSMDLSKLIPNENEVDRDFLYYYLMTDGVRRFMKDHSSGSTVLHLQTSKVPHLKIKIPENKNEQKTIAVILSRVDRVIELTEALIAKQQRLKTGLMQKLLTKGIDEHGNLRSEATHEFKDSPLGRIPAEWDFEPLLTFAAEEPNSFVNGPFGSDLLSAELKSEGVPVIYVRDIKPGAYQRVSTVHVTADKALQLKACNVQYGDVLIAKVGDPPCDTAPYLVSERAIVTQDVIRIRPSKKVSTLYISHLLNSHLGRKAIKVIIIQGTRARVSLTDFKTLRLPKPPYDEQGRIAVIIEKAQQDIHGRQILLEKLRLLKRGLMQDLLTGKIRVNALLEAQSRTDA